MYLRYGTGVWWTYDSFAEQVEAMMDCYEVLFPEFQICIEVDHSQGHAKKRVGALCVTDMNLNWGGKKDPIRPGEGSLMTNDCVCSQHAMMTATRKRAAPLCCCVVACILIRANMQSTILHMKSAD